MCLVMKAPVTEAVYEVSSEMVLTKGNCNNCYLRKETFSYSLSVLSVYRGSNEINIKIHIDSTNPS